MISVKQLKFPLAIAKGNFDIRFENRTTTARCQFLNIVVHASESNSIKAKSKH